MFIKHRTLQPLLAIPSDVVTNELVQTKRPKTLPIENENYELVEFEPVDNFLTHGNIIGIDVLVHYHEDVAIEFNYVLDYNDQNDAFSEISINICTLEVHKPKNHIYS